MRSWLAPVVIAAVAVSASSAAAPKPSISWTASKLSAGSIVRLADLLQRSPAGARSWRVAGSCSLRAATLVVGAAGTCTVRLTVSGKTSAVVLPIEVTSYSRTVGTTQASIVTPDGRTRTYTLHVPQTLPVTATVPLLVVLHGRNGWGANFEMTSGFDALADQDRFVAVYPDGYTPPGQQARSWNGGYCCAQAQLAGIDDVTFIRQLVHTLTGPQGIDAKRVYVAGYSNGAILAYRLACELSDAITAVGLQSGSLGVSTCAPSHPVPLTHIHGTADINAPIDGGVSTTTPGGVDQRSALSSAQAYATAIGATSGPATAIRLTNSDVSVSTWTGASPLAVVEYVVVTGATHAWMGHPQVASQDAFVGHPYGGLDSSAEIWAFVSRFSR